MARLKEYRANLIIFPRGSKHLPKNGDSSLEEQAAATQVRARKSAEEDFFLFVGCLGLCCVLFLSPCFVLSPFFVSPGWCRGIPRRRRGGSVFFLFWVVRSLVLSLYGLCLPPSGMRWLFGLAPFTSASTVIQRRRALAQLAGGRV